LANKQHSVALEQLAMRMSSVLKLGGPFDKVKSLISDMIARLEAQGSADASHKAYCDEELSESNEKKSEKQSIIEKLSTKIDQMTSRSAQLKEEVASLNKALAAIATSQAEADKLRQEEAAEFIKDKAEMEQGIDGVQTAIKIIRDYYAAEGKAHTAAEGASTGIIGLLEVCLSDFTKGLADMMATEDASATSYAKATMANKLETTAKSQDVKYKAAESAKLDKAVAEATADRSSTQDELNAVFEYLEKLKEQCVAKAEPYAERKARRDSEVAGLKQALEILDNQSFLQQTHRVLRGVRSHMA
jgi:DNA repair exonuclease SbcCD ATPase subunit